MSIIIGGLPTSDVKSCLYVSSVWHLAARKNLNRRLFVKSDLFGTNALHHTATDIIRSFVGDKKIKRIQTEINLGLPLKVLEKGCLILRNQLAHLHSLRLDVVPGSSKWNTWWLKMLLEVSIPIYPNISSLVLKVPSNLPDSDRHLLVTAFGYEDRLCNNIVDAFPNMQNLHIEDEFLSVLLAIIKNRKRSVSNVTISSCSKMREVLQAVDIPTSPGWSQLHITTMDIDVCRSWDTWGVVSINNGYIECRKLETLLSCVRGTLKNLVIQRLPWAKNDCVDLLILPTMPRLESLNITHYSEEKVEAADFSDWMLPTLFKMTHAYPLNYDEDINPYPRLTSVALSSHDAQADQFTRELGTTGLMDAFAEFIFQPQRSVRNFHTDVNLVRGNCTCDSKVKMLKGTQCECCHDWGRKCKALTNVKKSLPGAIELQGLEHLQHFSEQQERFYYAMSTLPKEYTRDNSDKTLSYWLQFRGNMFLGHAVFALKRCGIPVPEPLYRWRHQYPHMATTGKDASNDSLLRFLHHDRINDPLWPKATFVTGPVGVDLEPILNFYVNSFG